MRHGSHPHGITLASLRATFVAFGADKAPRLAAAIAYSTIFSIAPLLIILVGVATHVLGSNANFEARLINDLSHDAGPNAAKAVRGIVDSGISRPRAGVVAQTFAWIAFFFGASGLFSALQDALNAVWGIEGNDAGWKWIVRGRLASFLMTFLVGILLLATFLANSVIAIISSDFARFVPFVTNPHLLAFSGQATAFVLVTAIFALLFKILPDVYLAWTDVLFGAVVTAVLYTVGEYAISLYFVYGGVFTSYGAAASLLVALLWVYYSAMIMLLGAEFTKIHSRRVGLAVASFVRTTDDMPAGADPRDHPARERIEKPPANVS